jgi:predicted nuclease of predicted toxin-antitoxin system
MAIRIDAQLPPAIAVWIGQTFGMTAVALRDIGLRDATGQEIFVRARSELAIVMTKDSDFVRLLERLGPPPQIIWLTCGKTSNARLMEILMKTLSKAIEILQNGESLVEISGR